MTRGCYVEKRTNADISGHMRTNADSANFPFRNFASHISNVENKDSYNKLKKGENDRQPRPNGLVVSVGK